MDARRPIAMWSLSLLTVLVTGVLIASGGAPFAGASAGNGVISGRVDECGPGPIVITPTNNTPTPQPVVVRVLRGEHVVAYEDVSMAQHLPWTGTFWFDVPAGTYEVTSSYRGVARLVRLRAGGHVVVSFGLFACPMTGGSPPKL